METKYIQLTLKDAYVFTFLEKWFLSLQYTIFTI